MKLIGTIGLFLLLVSGCASSNNLDAQLKQLKDDMYTEIRNQKGDVRDSLKKEIKDLEIEMKKNIKDTENNLQNQIIELKEIQKKYFSETDKTVLDHQRQIFQNKAVMDDTARRVYMIEAVIAARGIPQQQQEEYITFIEDKKVAISVGSIHGVKVGDHFSIYRDKDKIGTIEIGIVDRDSSKGWVIENNKDISIGDRVELEKK